MSCWFCCESLRTAPNVPLPISSFDTSRVNRIGRLCCLKRGHTPSSLP